MKNSKLYLVLDRAVASYEKLFEVAKQAMAAGVDVIQLRDKGAVAKDILEFSFKMQKLLNNRIPYIINDRADLALASGADGVHLGQDDLPLSTAREIMGKKAVIGVSCQTFAQAREAEECGADYIGFGSVFKTQTKPERRPMDLRLLAKVVSRIKIPVFAIGGITKNNLPLIQSVGVRRVAITRAICQARDIPKETQAFKEILTVG